MKEDVFRVMADNAPVMIWMSGPDKLCTYFNKRWLDFTGRPAESELGNRWTEGIHPDDLKRRLDNYSESFDQRREFKMEYRVPSVSLQPTKIALRVPAGRKFPPRSGDGTPRV